MKKLLVAFLILAAAVLVGFLLIQLVPYGKNHTNPPVVSEPTWDSPKTKAIARRACFDCHSNETVWPWYSNVAPVSWLVQRDVDEGRSRMNFSEWKKFAGRRNANEISEILQEGEMPPAIYLIQHPEARLSNTEKDLFIKGIIATLK